MRILIADDEHLARITLRSNLEEISPNNEIFEVTNGLELINEAPISNQRLPFVMLLLQNQIEHILLILSIVLKVIFPSMRKLLLNLKI